MIWRDDQGTEKPGFQSSAVSLGSEHHPHVKEHQPLPAFPVGLSSVLTEITSLLLQAKFLLPQSRPNKILGITLVLCSLQMLCTYSPFTLQPANRKDNSSLYKEKKIHIITTKGLLTSRSPQANNNPLF